MIVLQHPDADPTTANGRAFIPDGETAKRDELLAQGYRIWQPATVPPAVVAGETGTTPTTSVDFTTLSGVGDELAALFVERGWQSFDDLRNATDEQLLSLSGIGLAKLAKIRSQLVNLNE